MSRWILKKVDEDYDDVLAENGEKRARIFNVLGRFTGRINPVFSEDALKNLEDKFFVEYLYNMKREMNRYKPCLMTVILRLAKAEEQLNGGIAVWVAFKGDMDDRGDFQKSVLTVLRAMTADIFGARFMIDDGMYRFNPPVFNKIRIQNVSRPGKEVVDIWKKQKEDIDIKIDSHGVIRLISTHKYITGSIADLREI